MMDALDMAETLRASRVSRDQSSNNLVAVVDMGSNGIRFTITDLSPSVARILPTIYNDRAGISLYDAQFAGSGCERQAISEDVQSQVVQQFKRFKQVCVNKSIPDAQVHVLATEALRLAPNALTLSSKITKATGWKVNCLTPGQEAELGAAGVASCTTNAHGLIADMGGGSCQLSWINFRDGCLEGNTKAGVSLPYGAAALTARLKEAKRQGEDALASLKKEVHENLKRAVATAVAQKPHSKDGSVTLYVCGGSLRGLGYLLMDVSSASPIPFIDGFEVPLEALSLADAGELSAARSRDVFGVSDRRKKHMDAISFLVSILRHQLEGLITRVKFCQTGIREGFLFGTLTPERRLKNPLIVATQPYATKSATEIAHLLACSLPQSETTEQKGQTTCILDVGMVTAVANMMYAHAGLVKQYRPRMALHSTTDGMLACTHGLTHQQRAALALILCERWNGDLPSADEDLANRFQMLVGAKAAWWCKYLGRIARLIATVNPDGAPAAPYGGIPAICPVLMVDASFVPNPTKESAKGNRKSMLQLFVEYDDGEFGEDSKKALKKIEKLGKAKNFVSCETISGYAESFHKAADPTDSTFGMKISVAR